VMCPVSRLTARKTHPPIVPTKFIQNLLSKMPTAPNKDKLPGDNNNKCSNKTERDADDALIIQARLALGYVITRARFIHYAKNSKLRLNNTITHG